jgi:hypothetical protein
LLSLNGIILIFKQRYNGPAGRYFNSSFDIKGKQMFNVGAGVAFQTLKTKKILVTAGLAKLTSKTTKYSSEYYPTGVTTYQTTTANDHQNILMISASLVL